MTLIDPLLPVALGVAMTLLSQAAGAAILMRLCRRWVWQASNSMPSSNHEPAQERFLGRDDVERE